MVIFLNLDGTARKVVPEHIFQGSNNVTDIEVLTGYPASTALEINFILPDGTRAFPTYQPMLYVPYEVQPLIGAYTYSLPVSVTEQAGDCYASVNAVDPNGNRTSYLVKFIVEPSVLPELPPAPEPDVYELLLRYLQEQGAEIAGLDDRVTRLENVNVKRVMIDLTSEVKGSEAIFTKWYSDGTTASFSVPLQSGGSTIGNGLVAVAFTKESWVNVKAPSEKAEYELAFAPQQTGMQTAQFLIGVDLRESYVYEVGAEIVPSERDGYSALANRAFKGSDGSVLLMGVRVPFDGEILCYNGKLDGDKDNVVGITLTEDGTGLVVSYQDAPAETLVLNVYSKSESDGITNALDERLQNAESEIGKMIGSKPGFVVRLTASSWSGSTKPYTIEIPKSVYGDKANGFAVIFLNNVVGKVEYGENGLITLSSDVKKDVTILII